MPAMGWGRAVGGILPRTPNDVHILVSKPANVLSYRVEGTMQMWSI